MMVQMMKNWLSLLAVVLLFTCVANAQVDERTLFSVDGVPVTVDEFTYIYSKTNGNGADFSRASLEEYLDLYVKFKLKVARAKEMQLDTIPTLMKELAGYRRQLADSYLIDRSVTDKLVEAAYERVKDDIDISHILFTLGKNPSPEDTLAVYQKAQTVLTQINKGADFAEEAKNSADRFSKDRGGRVGFITAPFPKGLHRLEAAAYNSPIGKVVGPIRSAAGYHLLKVNERRPARGELEAAHILLRKDDAKTAANRKLIDSLHRALMNGADFDNLVRQYSEDKHTASNNGYLGFFGIKKYEKAFEDAAFSIKEDGDFSKPVETSTGLHIIRRISKKDIQPFAIEKARLEQKIRADERFSEAKERMLVRIRKESNYRANKTVLDNFAKTLDDTFVTFRWRAPANPSPDVLFTLGDDYMVTLGMFTDYLGRASRARAQAAREGTPQAAANKLYNDFVDDQLMKYEETQLESKYPAFKSLMREYEEGILLFEATKLEVWDKAAQDSVGLVAFFDKIEGKYRWPERAKGILYRMGLSQRGQLPMVQDYAKRHDVAEVLKRFNTPEKTIVTAEENILEQNRLPGKSVWEVGAVSEAKENERAKSITFFKIKEILPVADKTLNEARGYVVADYQDELERRWVDQLRADHKVKVNKKVFESLIK